MRRKLAAGNWKMNTTVEEGKRLASEIINMFNDEVNNGCELILFPPFLGVSSVVSLSKHDEKIGVGVQNCHQAAAGAYTGEISTKMIAAIGVKYVLLGHSERREYFNETDDLINSKLKAVLAEGLIPVFCCGETQIQRVEKEHFNLIETQLRNGLAGLTEAEALKIIVAYEPVWAIGTGLTASPEQAQEMHAFIRGIIDDMYGIDIAQNCPILYGGSVKPDNAKLIFSMQDIDGGLVGGASLKSRDFIDIAKGF